MVMVFALGSVSGGHFNPAVTLAVLISGRCKIDLRGCDADGHGLRPGLGLRRPLQPRGDAGRAHLGEVQDRSRACGALHAVPNGWRSGGGPRLLADLRDGFRDEASGVLHP